MSSKVLLIQLFAGEGKCPEKYCFRTIMIPRDTLGPGTLKMGSSTLKRDHNCWQKF